VSLPLSGGQVNLALGDISKKRINFVLFSRRWNGLRSLEAGRKTRRKIAERDGVD
jgi:hypothetical protein